MSKKRSIQRDADFDSMFMLAMAMGGASTNEVADSINRRGHSELADAQQLPIKGSPGFDDHDKPRDLTRADEEIAALEERIARGDTDVGRVAYQLERWREAILLARRWAATGIEFGETIDNLFRAAKFPQGWHLVPTDHEMYSHLVDDRGRVRASIFYKSVFYDREASVTLVSRFSVARHFMHDDSRTFPRRGGEVEKIACHVYENVPGGERRSLFLTPVHEIDMRDRQRDASFYDEVGVIECKQRNACIAWLDEHRPLWRDVEQQWTY